MSREFVHLHVHTEHSTRDGLSSPARICREASADGARAVAVTDHGTLAGAWRFDEAARAAGLKPIIGEEVYWAIGSRRDHDSIRVPRELDDGADAGDGDGDARTGAKTKTYEHLTMLAQTPEGWSNLSRMATASADSFWVKTADGLRPARAAPGRPDRPQRVHRRPGCRPAAARQHRRCPRAQPAALLRAPEPDPTPLLPPIGQAGDATPQILTSPQILTTPTVRRLQSPGQRPAPAEPPGAPLAVVVDVLTLPAGVSLRRASADSPAAAALLARYPELAAKEAAQSIRSADPGCRSGLLPHRTDTGCYLAVLITDDASPTRVNTVTTGAGNSVSGTPADAVAGRLLAAHIDGMATKKPPLRPAIPVKGQLPLFPLPGQLPEPAPSTTRRDRPAPDAQHSGTAA